MATAFQLPDTDVVPLGRVLVVDDDRSIRSALTTWVEGQGGDGVALADASSVVSHIDRGAFSVVVLDVELGKSSGFDVLRQIRRFSDIPVILTASERHDPIDRVLGLELGADDYICKPLCGHEVVARIRATLRRQELGRSRRQRADRGGLRFAGWELHRKSRSLNRPDGRPVPLTRTEFALLTALAEAPNRILSREQLLAATRTNDDIYDRSVDVQVLRLRRKLQLQGANSHLIHTERGLGYRFDATVERFH